MIPALKDLNFVKRIRNNYALKAKGNYCQKRCKRKKRKRKKKKKMQAKYMKSDSRKQFLGWQHGRGKLHGVGTSSPGP